MRQLGAIIWRCRWLCFISACHAFAAGAAAAEGFAPIPVQAVYLPDATRGSADDDLARGRVVQEAYPMAAPARTRWRIAFLFPHLKDPYWVGCAWGVLGEAARLGITADIFVADGYDDLIGQLHQIDEAIAAKYDAIVLSPIHMTAANAAIAQARQQGIPVFELANDSSGSELVTKVTTSLKGMGREAAEWAVHDAQRRGMKSVSFALLPGPRGAGWVIGEVEGVREVARTAPIRVRILATAYGDSDRIVQTRLAEQMLAARGARVDYVLGCTGCAPAVIAPLRARGLAGKVKVVAFDLTREIAALIRSGAIAAAADTRGVSQARVATDAAVNYLEGRTPHPPADILITLGRVDRQSLARYPLEGSIAPRGFDPTLSIRGSSAEAPRQ